MSQTKTIGNISLVSLRKEDATQRTDHWVAFESLVLKHEDQYPGIQSWLKAKVAPQLNSGERIAAVAYVNDRPVVAKVLKKGVRSKICHLSVDEEFQHNALGRMCFVLSSLFLKNIAKEVYFTLPATLWETKRSFFNGFGFHDPSPSVRQYRQGSEELACRLSFDEYWLQCLRVVQKASATTLGRTHNEFPSLLLSLIPRYAEAILAGTKRVEIRKSFSPDWKNSVVGLYASRQLGAVVGTARVEDVVIADAAEIWDDFGPQIGCSKAEFEQYANGSKRLSAITLGEVKRYDSPVSRVQLAELINEPLRPPLSHQSISATSGWASAFIFAAWASAL